MQLAGLSEGRRDFSVLNSKQNVAVLQRAEAMGDDKRRAAADQALGCPSVGS